VPKSRRNPRKFHTAVQDLVGRNEIPIVSKALVRHGADARLALAAVLEMPAEVAQVKDRK